MKALLSLLLCQALSALTSPLFACHLSNLTLDSVVQNGSNYDIYVELCIGGGPGGADDKTLAFQFAFYSAGSVNLISFTPSVTSSLNRTYLGYDMGSGEYPFGAANIWYTNNVPPNPPTQEFECIVSGPCGTSAHQTCRQFIFTLDAQPDSIRALMIEGNFNPTGGCYPDADMIAYLSGSPPPLPVEMTDFTARPLADGQVQLRWETAQEINVNRFEVLRSKDGIHWDLAGSVEACGSCSFTNYYEFFDKPASSGTWYYRILTVDNDGSIEHSPTATVELKAEKSLRIAPNPAASGISAFTIYGLESQQQEMPGVQLHDLRGQLIWSGQAVNAGDGSATISLDEQLAPGMYLISLEDRPGEHFKLLVKD